MDLGRSLESSVAGGDAYISAEIVFAIIHVYGR